MTELDPIDRRILRELQRDAGVGAEALGERVGLSRNACWRRIRLMEEAGVITARVALVDPDALGLTLTVFIAVRTDRHEPEWLDTFTRAVKGMPEILGVWRTSGDLDYLLKARVADVLEIALVDGLRVVQEQVLRRGDHRLSPYCLVQGLMPRARWEMFPIFGRID